MELELIVKTDLTRDIPTEIPTNIDELKVALAERLDRYNKLIITDESIQEGKKDRARLNALKTAIDNRRKEVKKAFNAPVAKFESEVKELTALIDAPIQAIDRQLEVYEEKRKEEKQGDIDAIWSEFLAEDKVPAGITLAKIFDPKWLNATVSPASIKKTMEERFAQIARDLVVCDGLDAFNFEARETYLDTLDLGRALTEVHRLREQEEKRKAWEAEQARRKAAQDAAEAARTVCPPVSTPEPQTPPVASQEAPVASQKAPVDAEKQDETVYRLRLELQVTMKQANALKAFLADNNINYHKI